MRLSANNLPLTALSRISNPIQRILPTMLSRHLLIAACAVALAITASAFAQTLVPGQIDRSEKGTDTSMNYPVEPKVADRGGLTMPGRSMPYELAMPQGFDRVYSVPGKSGMFYRADGGLYLVFDQGEYARRKKGPEYAMVPAGGVYYIGKPDWSRLICKSVVPAGAVNSQQAIRVEGSAVANGGTATAERVAGPVAPAARTERVEREIGVSVPLGQKLPAVSGSKVGFGGGDPTNCADELSDSKPAEFASKAPDTAAWSGTLPDGVDRSFLVGDGADVRPRILVDFIYREDRLSKLILRATHSSRQQ